MASAEVSDGVEWLGAANEILYRQVHPLQMKGTVPASVAFRPSEAHEYTLSTTREFVGARGAYEQHVAAKHESAGSWAITVGECAEVDLDAFDDSKLPGNPRGHVSVPFGIPVAGNPGRKRLDSQAQHLKKRAIARGCQYVPPTPGLGGMTTLTWNPI